MPSKSLDLILKLKKEGTGASEAARELGGVEKAAKVAGAAISAFAVVETARAAFELAELGAQSIRTKNAFVAISGGADQARDRLEAMQRATRGALSEQQAMAAANRLMQMGLANNADELEQISRMAVQLGAAMGKEAGPAIEEFALMLANTSIPRLDTFGISAGRVRTTMKELAATFPEMSREQRFMIATMEEGEAAMGRLGDAAEDELLSFERLKASWADLKAAAGEMLAPAMAEGVGAMAKLTAGIVNEREELEALRAEFGKTAVEAAQLNETMGLGGDTLDDLRQRSQETANAMDFARARSEGLAKAMGPMAGAAEEAAGSLDGLATSAGTVAKSFGEMTFDNQQLWNMAAAAGKDVEELEKLAHMLGIATEAETQATLETYALIEAFGQGELTAQELTDQYHAVADVEMRLGDQAAYASGEFETLTGGMQEGVEAADGLAGSMDGAAGSLLGASSAAGSLALALSRIEREVYVDIYIEEHGQRPTGEGAQRFQGGGTTPGGLAWVGEGGPELAWFPPGVRIYSAGESRHITNNTRGGDTFVINDPLAAAMVMDERRRATASRLGREL